VLAVGRKRKKMLVSLASDSRLAKGAKMKSTAWTTMFLVAVLAAQASAQESTRQDFHEFCKAIQGRWVGDVTWVADWPGFGKRGDKVTAYWEGRLAEDGNILIGKFFGGDGSETSLIYFDAGAKQIRWTMVSSRGAVTQSVVYRKDGKWRQAGNGSLPDGTRTEYTSTAIISDDGNQWIWEGSGNVGGEPTADQHDVWRRVSK
jgi:hypothetical protein